MHLHLVLLAAVVFVCLVHAKPIPRCHLDDESELFQQRESQILQDSIEMAEAHRSADRRRRRGGGFVLEAIQEIPVVFHIIMDDKGEEGYLPLDSLQKQIDLANSVMDGSANSRGTGFDSRMRFLFSGATYHYNTAWFKDFHTYSTQTLVRTETNVSPATHLNIYTCWSDRLLGWVNFLPHEVFEYSLWNGVNLNYRAFPASAKESGAYSPHPGTNGGTFAHEVGHALGLLHTFGNGRTGCTQGDGIADTPAEETPAFGDSCLSNPPRNTCPNMPGQDPVWNVMDYSSDRCAEEFTRGQIEHMKFNIAKYKPNLVKREPIRAVTDGKRGTAKAMTMCRSDCFVQGPAPDGHPNTVQGYCFTDAQGNWGTCCSDVLCRGSLPATSFPSTLSCGQKQWREELLKSFTSPTMCLRGGLNADKEKQIDMAVCSDSPYVRWTLYTDGSINNVGTSLCLRVSGGDLAKEGVIDKHLELAPCDHRDRNQRFTYLKFGRSGPQQLELRFHPGVCLDVNYMRMKPCAGQNNPAQRWERYRGHNCSRFSRKRRACVFLSPSLFGCSCRFTGKKKCVG